MPKTKYQAKDGKLFDDYKEAEQYEDDLFRQWLSTSPMVDILALISDAPDECQDEYYGTPKDFAIHIARIEYGRRDG